MYAAGSRPSNFHLWGAMGAAVPLALGLALGQADRPVVSVTSISLVIEQPVGTVIFSCSATGTRLSGSVAYLCKPFDGQTLLSVIDHVLDHRRPGANARQSG